MNAFPPERTIEKEDGSNGDEPEQVNGVTLHEPRPMKIEPVGAPSCGLDQGRLNLEAYAPCSGQQVCQQGGPPGPGSDIDEDIVVRHARPFYRLQHRCNWARQVGSAPARELGIVIRDLVKVPQQVQPRIAIPRRDVLQFGPETRGSSLVAQQKGPYLIRSISER